MKKYTKKVKNGYVLEDSDEQKDAINKLGEVEACESKMHADYKTAFMLAGTLMKFVSDVSLCKENHMPILTYKKDKDGKIMFGMGSIPTNENELEA